MATDSTEKEGIVLSWSPEALEATRRRIAEMTPQQLAELEFQIDAKCGTPKPLESYYAKYGVLVG